MLKECAVALHEAYDLAMLDLDGVVYIGPDPVERASAHLATASSAGMKLAYITNNAARTPAMVAQHLRELNVPADDEDIVTSAQAAARLVAEQVPTGSDVFVIGGAGLFEALTEVELSPVQLLDPEPSAVVSGYHPDLLWKTVVNGAILVRRGLPWVASNTDLTVPTAHGVGPGNGVLVDVVARFAGRDAVVAGKPQQPLFEETIRRVGGQRPLVVGDRLDTDIAGACNSGLDSLLVMTGVTGLEELVAASPAARPSYISADLGGLATSHPLPKCGDGVATVNDWSAQISDGTLRVDGNGSADDWWRVVAAAAWMHLDHADAPVDVSGLTPPGSVDA